MNHKDSTKENYRVEKMTEWVSGGDFAVAVEVEVVFPIDSPNEPCYRPETMRRLEYLRRCAEAGDIAELQRAGRVYQLRTEAAV